MEIKMKKVFLYFYDRHNFGDDMFIISIAKRYPNVRFYLWTSKSYIATFKDITNIKVLGYQFIPKTLYRIRPSFLSRYRAYIENHCNAVVYIGGSIFIEYKNWKNIINWWDYEAKNRKFYVLGANFGPYKDERFRDGYARVFENMKDICFRDNYSYNMFSDVSTVRVAPDILWGTQMPSPTRTKKNVFVSVINCEHRSELDVSFSEYEKNYLVLIINMIKYWFNKEYDVTLASFCKIEEDEFAINKILNNFGPSDLKKIEVVKYNGNNLNQMLQCISNSSIVICSRFHATILGILAGKPVIPIVYSDKTIHMLNDIGFKGLVIDIRNLNSSYYPQDFDLEKQRFFGCNALNRESQKQFWGLDKILL